MDPITDTNTPATPNPQKAQSVSEVAGTVVDDDSMVTEKPKAAPKPAWEPSEQVANAMLAIAAIDHTDKKGIARIVKAAIDLRTDAKATRDRAEVAGDES